MHLFKSSLLFLSLFIGELVTLVQCHASDGSFERDIERVVGRRRRNARAEIQRANTLTKRTLTSLSILAGGDAVSCDSTQQAAIKQGINDAIALASTASAILGVSRSETSDAFSQWYGDSNTGIRGAIKTNNYDALIADLGAPARALNVELQTDNLDATGLTFICAPASFSSCSKGGTIAIAHQSDSDLQGHVITLCPLFFTLPSQQAMLAEIEAGKFTQASRGFTILHEVQHLSVIVGSERRCADQADSNAPGACYSVACCINLEDKLKVLNAQNMAFFAADVQSDPSRGAPASSRTCVIQKRDTSPAPAALLVNARNYGATLTKVRRLANTSPSGQSSSEKPKTSSSAPGRSRTTISSKSSGTPGVFDSTTSAKSSSTTGASKPATSSKASGAPGNSKSTTSAKSSSATGVSKPATSSTASKASGAPGSSKSTTSAKSSSATGVSKPLTTSSAPNNPTTQPPTTSKPATTSSISTSSGTPGAGNGNGNGGSPGPGNGNGNGGSPGPGKSNGSGGSSGAGNGNGNGGSTNTKSNAPSTAAPTTTKAPITTASSTSSSGSRTSSSCVPSSSAAPFPDGSTSADQDGFSSDQVAELLGLGGAPSTTSSTSSSPPSTTSSTSSSPPFTTSSTSSSPPAPTPTLQLFTINLFWDAFLTDGDKETSIIGIWHWDISSKKFVDSISGYDLTSTVSGSVMTGQISGSGDINSTLTSGQDVASIADPMVFTAAIDKSGIMTDPLPESGNSWKVSSLDGSQEESGLTVSLEIISPSESLGH